jgi:SAM-dependent methyltransferase
MPGAETFRHAPAEAYDRLVGRYSPQLATGLLAFAGVRAPARALDVGCGPGALTSALAAALGAGAVAAIDPSEPFAAACAARNPGVDVRVASAGALPFADGAFDAVASQLVVNFLPDAPAAVREMARVTRPGGVIAACVWDYAEGMTLLRAFWDAAAEVAPARARDGDEGAVMAWCGRGELGGLWRDAGLREVRETALTAEGAYAGFDDLWVPLTAGVGPSGAFCASLDTAGRAALREALRRRLGAGDGPFTLSARAWAVAGVVA